MPLIITSWHVVHSKQHLIAVSFSPVQHRTYAMNTTLPLFSYHLHAYHACQDSRALLQVVLYLLENIYMVFPSFPGTNQTYRLIRRSSPCRWATHTSLAPTGNQIPHVELAPPPQPANRWPKSSQPDRLAAPRESLRFVATTVPEH